MMRRSSVIGLVVALVALLAAGLAVVSASDDSGQPETFETRLEPGNNLVGWTTHSAPVKELFEQLPQIDVVWTWDVEWRRWRIAAPNMPEDMWTLRSLRPGMGLLLRLGGDRPIEWERPRRPVQGLVELRNGHNFVAWMGRDDTPLDLVARGVGRTLESVRVWSEESSEVASYSPTAIDNQEHQPQIAYGQALWVEVGRSVNWLQPTGYMPKVVIAGNVSRRLSSAATDAMQTTIDFYYEHFGIEADFSRFTAIFPMDNVSYVEAFNANLPGGIGPQPAPDRKGFSSDAAAGWAGPGFLVARLDIWQRQGASSQRGPSTTLHEYAHVIQSQLRGAFDFFGSQRSEGYPSWVTEGVAVWMQYLFEHTQGTPWESLRQRATRGLRGRAPLSDYLSSSEDTYAVGVAAALEFASSPDSGVLLDFHRAMLADNIGHNARWLSYRDWRHVFAEEFLQPVDEFYEEFESNRKGARGRQRHLHSHDPPLISGRITDSSGSLRYKGATVIVNRVKPDSYVGQDTVELGRRFEIPVEAGNDYAVAVRFGDPPCLGIWSNNGLVGSYRQADFLKIVGKINRRLTIDLADQPCTEVVTGRLLSESGEPIGGIRIALLNDDRSTGQFQGFPGTHPPSTLTGEDGRFHFSVPPSTRYSLRIELAPGCRVEQHGAAVDSSRVGLLEIRIPNSACALRIVGRLTDADGKAIAGSSIYAVAQGEQANAISHSDGSFAIPISREGQYRLRVNVDGCWVEYKSENTTSGSQATLITIDDDDVIGLTFALPAGACSSKITGKLLDADGNPVANVNVSAWPEDGSSGSAQTESDGSFAITVPESGEYRLSTRIDGCNVYYRRDSATGSYQQATRIRVSDSDVTGVTFQLARGMCELRISGKLLNADGSPRSGQWVSAGGNAGNAGASTAADGSFSFAVPASGSYRLSAWVDGCSIYRGSRGPVKNWNSASQVRVSDADVTGIEFRLPEDPSTFCN